MTTGERYIFGILGFLWDYVTRATEFLLPLVKALARLRRFVIYRGDLIRLPWIGSRPTATGLFQKVVVPASSVYDQNLRLSPSLAIGSFVIGQTVPRSPCLIECQLPEHTVGIMNDPCGDIFLPGIDYEETDSGLLLMRPFDRFSLVPAPEYDRTRKEIQIFYAIWCIVETQDQPGGLVSVLTDSGSDSYTETLWKAYVSGCTVQDMQDLLSSSIGVTTAHVAGMVTKVWQEGDHHFVLIQDKLHSAPEPYVPTVTAGTAVLRGDRIFRPLDFIRYNDSARLAVGDLYLPAGEDVVVVPNASVPVVAAGGRNIPKLQLLSGKDYVAEELAHNPSAKSPVPAHVTQVNAIQYLWGTLWKDRLTVLDIDGLLREGDAAAVSEALRKARDIINPGSALAVVQRGSDDSVCSPVSVVSGEAGYCAEPDDVVHLSVTISDGSAVFV